MAKDTQKSTTEKAKKPSKIHKLSALCKDERTRFIVGLLLLLVGSALGLSFVSFLFTGDADQALLEHTTLGTLTSVDNGISNWMGSFGAYAAELFINRWMGVGAFLFIWLTLKTGFTLMRFDSAASLPRLFVKCALWCIWISLFFGFFFVSGYQDSFLYLGGHHGYDFARLMQANVGWAGTFLVILTSFILLSLFVFKGTIRQTRRIIDLYPRLMRYRRERRAAARAAAMAAAAAVEAATVEATPTPQAEETPVRPEMPDADYETPEPKQERRIEPDEEDPYDPDLISETEDEVFQAPADTLEDDAETLEPEDAPGEPTETMPDEPLTPDEEEDVADSKPAMTIQNGDFTVSSHPVETVDAPMIPIEDYDPTAELSYYKFPTFDLLKKYDDGGIPIDMDEQNANKEKIKQTLLDYGIEIQSISATVGPTITLFEIVPQLGTRIAKIRGLQDEIAMSIAASTGIRIIAPIPGKTAIGIEVPNKDPQVVSMHSVITSRTFQESRYELPVALGKTITNEVFTFDLAKMPHLLVAGATGQGKSVGLNAIITSLLYKKHPSQLKMVLIDPKQVEFSIYSRIEKHYLAKLPDEAEPIITDVSKVVATLNSVCVEMEDRYALLKDAGLRNIKEYNEKFIHRQLNPKRGHKYLPYIVVVVDEYGDLIMTAGKEIELPIARIAQKARAVGIHMIIATQRPSAKIITGIIKANFPARMAFRVGQSIDSSIILDQPGAQHLIGRGDLLFSTGNNLTRVQCAFVDTPEVDRINRYIADQQSYPTAFLLPEPPENEGMGSDGGNSQEVDMNHLDPLFNEVAELVVVNQQGSTSMIQRKFSIGYNRAGRIMDQLEAAGIVGPYEGSKARSVIVGDAIELEQVLQNIRRQ